jgi:dihydrofolate reductase
VVSTTLSKVKWQNSTLIKGGLAEKIAGLKGRPGKDIAVTGSPTLVHSLLESGLLDQLTLFVHPVVAGSGKRLFKDGSDLKRLELVDSMTTRTGVATLTYHPRRD